MNMEKTMKTMGFALVVALAYSLLLVKPALATSFGAYYGHENAPGGSGIVVDTIDGRIVGVTQTATEGAALKLAALHIGLLAEIYHVKVIKVKHQGNDGFILSVNPVKR